MLPFEPSHETLWLESSVYDVLAVIGYNDAPIVPGHGSAIFFHVASPNFGPTAGCVSMLLDDLVWILGRINENTFMNID